MSHQETTIYRLDYQAYPYHIDKVNLHFSLDPQQTLVTSTLSVRAKQGIVPMVLNGEDIVLKAIELNGKPLENYELNEGKLCFTPPEASFELKITTTCQPQENTSLMGLYVSGKSFFTQCEAEGFRRISFFPDRPDVMSEYTVTLQADKKAYPYLLSNGNLLSERDLGGGRHEAIWHDPFLKPCYLFALVAGDFDVLEKRSLTRSGREVLLQVYSDKGNQAQTQWALDSLERSMKWDETRFGLELDLDRFMIVAARDFNMGAMENKGLNIFNAAYVLADPETATDVNYEGIESVVGHEYFHNWTGNRVTCQDWFQLSLKEGLTVFRDQEFSADMMARELSPEAASSARAVKRIDDVIRLRSFQFPEDASPMAHPIRPESYQEIGNFYTATVYEKGAEVIRMQHTLLGEAGFRAGMDEYFRRHDGQAVTCDDFVNAMESVYQTQSGGKDLSIFRRWYSQAGTPTVTVSMDYDEKTQTCTLHLSQETPKVGVEKQYPEKEKLPFHIPFHLGMLRSSGEMMPLEVEPFARATENHGVLLELSTAQQTWVFKNVPERPVLSLLRDFSAPVNVHYSYSTQELAILCAHDVNAFSRWEAMQTLMREEILRLSQKAHAKETLSMRPEIMDVWAHHLNDKRIDPAYRALLLTLPDEKELFNLLDPITPLALQEARRFVMQTVARTFQQTWLSLYQENHEHKAYRPDPESVGKRSLKNLALRYLLSIQDQDAIALAKIQYEQAQNMTDRMGALAPLVHETQEGEIYSQAFYHAFEHNPLVMDKWFALQAVAAKSLDDIKALMQNSLFTLKNPNRVRALLFQFCMNNTRVFHQAESYQFWAEHVMILDQINPEIAARFARILDNWQRFALPNQQEMQKALQTVMQCPTLSKNTAEIVSKALHI